MYSMPSGARMTMRHAPPGLTSSSHTGLVKFFGPHHCAICFGSVQALKTMSGGASKNAREHQAAFHVLGDVAFGGHTLLLVWFYSYESSSRYRKSFFINRLMEAAQFWAQLSTGGQAQGRKMQFFCLKPHIA